MMGNKQQNRPVPLETIAKGPGNTKGQTVNTFTHTCLQRKLGSENCNHNQQVTL